jgi:hypothetical protein
MRGRSQQVPVPGVAVSALEAPNRQKGQKGYASKLADPFTQDRD